MKDIKAIKNIVKRKKGSEVISVLGILGVVVIILAILLGLMLLYVGKTGAKTVLNEITSSLSSNGITISATTDAKTFNDFKRAVEKLSGKSFSGNSFTGVTLKKIVGGSFDNQFSIELHSDDNAYNLKLVEAAFSKINGSTTVSNTGGNILIVTDLAR